MHAYLNIAVKAARRAGKIILRGLQDMDRVEVASKGALNDFVTTIDKASEADIIETIRRAYPAHAILGEETGASEGEEPVRWIIDPLDGTLNFIHGVPHFAVSIGIEVKGQLEHGVVYDPVKEELFTASKGEGAQLNERRIRTTNCAKLEYALLANGFPYKTDINAGVNPMVSLAHILERCSDIRMPGAAALNLAYIACGRLDGYWELGIKPWDIAAGIVLVREAGGFVTDYDGDTNNFDNQQIVAGTRKLHPQLLHALQHGRGPRQ